MTQGTFEVAAFLTVSPVFPVEFGRLFSVDLEVASMSLEDYFPAFCSSVETSIPSG